jgi:alkylation response protein AidB-like acyl-CoA dehydrogenase
VSPRTGPDRTTDGRELSLLADDVEDDLRETVRRALARACPPERVAACADGDASVGAEVWSTLARDLGLAGLLVPEQHGGAGASAREAAVVLEELGRLVAPAPYLTSSVVAATLLTSVGDADDELLPLLAAGEAVVALLLPAAAPVADGRAVTADADGTLNGTVRNVVGVAGGVPADVLLVPVAGDAGVALHAVRTTAPGVEVTAVTSLDMTRPLADVTLQGAVPRVVAEDATDALAAALLTGAGLLAAEQVGLATWCLEATVAHLRERRQFGRVVGGFQALKHRLADLYAEVESANAAARYAAAALAAGDPDVPVAVSVAQSYCAGVAVHAAEEAVQLHGGLGMTWEHPAHLHLKRAKADQLLLGSPEAHRARLATLVDLPAPDPERTLHPWT